MSSNKKSSGTLILLLLLFVAIAGGSWYYFTKMSTSADNTEVAQPLADDSMHGEDHDHGPDTHTHDNNASATTAGQIGDKGVIKPLSIKPILGRRGVGDPNAPVKVQEFFSLTCNHCADFHTGAYQTIKEEYIDTGKLYFIYEEFPLNGPALYGSMISRCLPEERYSGFLDLLLRSQDEWAFGGDFKASLMQNAKLAGMSEEEFNTCFENEELQKTIALNIKEASDTWKVSSTPTFVFNDGARILRGSHTSEEFGQVIAELTNNPEATIDNPEEVSETSEELHVVPEEDKKYDDEWYRAKAENVLEHPDPSSVE